MFSDYGSTKDRQIAVYNKTKAQPNPLLRASYFSKVFFWWLKDIVWYSKNNDLTTKDLYDTVAEDHCETLRRVLESAWIIELKNACKKNKKPSLWKIIAKTYFSDFVKYATLLALFVAIQLFQPFLLQKIISYFQASSTMTPEWAYTYVTIFISLDILRTASVVQGTFYLSRLGMRARIACSSLIYKKMLQLSSPGTQQTNISVMSLLSVDVAKFDGLFYHGPMVILVPLQFVIVTYLIYQLVGIFPAVTGVTLMLLQTMPFQAVYSRLVLKFRAKQATSTDRRIQLIAEIINGMKAVKMYVWENYMKELVYQARSLEIGYYLKVSYLSSVVYTFFTTSHRVCSFAILLIYQLHYGLLVPVIKILPVIQHLANLQNNCVYFFFALRNFIDACVSVERIENFLLLEEVKIQEETIRDKDDRLVSIKNVTASWDDTMDTFKDFSLNFKTGKLYTVIGSVGSGKTSLLKLILREFNPTIGEVLVQGKVSYASQEPWLFNGSVKDNILFGEKYHEERYEKVIRVCALSKDINNMPYGDKTLVGERGSSLSGGQCARINLARAVYREADIYLLDDPLSSVDARVAKTIMKDCINSFLADKMRILVTHSTQQFDKLAEVVILDDGKAKFKGTMKDDRFVEQFISNEIDFVEKTTKRPKIRTSQIVDEKSNLIDEEESNEAEELIAKKAMKNSIYLSYFKAGGWNLMFWTLIMNCVYVAAASTYDFGLAAWSTNEAKNNSIMIIQENLVENFSVEEKSLTILGTLMTLVVFTSFMKAFFLFKFSFNVGRNVHNWIFSRLMDAPMRFFETNQIGRILNRFSGDTEVVDNVLPQILVDATNVISLILVALVTAIVANWWILIVCIVFLIISLSIGRIYVRAIQKVKRLVGIARSPILSLVKSSLVGLTTIRACKAETIMIQDFNSRQDHHTQAHFLSITLVEAFSIWIQMINLGLLASITYFFLVLKDDNTYEGYVGLSIVQIFMITQLTSATGMRVADALANMTSVERMLQFTELEQEALVEKEPGIDVPKTWPDRGRIRFENFYMRYSDNSDHILSNVNCVIEAGSKIGIVGRTGAGKSSLISALFRFAKTDGLLLIDGVDVKNIDLHILRSKISIIPQESILFSGSLRMNLDPSKQFDDVTLWSALESVELKDIFDSLDYQIVRSGSNLSVGQRQLICLARASILKNKIIVLDEATANIDSTTDALIQKTIRNKFKECTVLIIAHRLETVMDCDKVLVMDEGRLVEYDHPMLLLQNNDGYLYKMVELMGKSAMHNFIDIAEQAYITRESADK